MAPADATSPCAASARTPREKRIKVCVRVRPFTKNEAMKAGGKAAWTWHENSIYQKIFPAQAPTRRQSTKEPSATLHSSGMSSGSHNPLNSSASSSSPSSALPSSYAFDHLYPPETTTPMLYDQSIKDVVLAAMDGYHASVFLYGQTGTGKTYTMQGDKYAPGMIELAVHDIFDHIRAHPTMEFLLRFSYLEIYNERIYDLLAAGTQADVKIQDIKTVDVHGNEVTDVVLQGLCEEIVLSVDHVLSLVEMGNFHRHVATTETNSQSSRSHTIFRLVVESQVKPQDNPSQHHPQTIRSATLSLIDLAGSESVRVPQASDQHQEEGKYINRSLLTLGHIIWKLSRHKHQSAETLPYRNSKLTRILQPSLGGKAQIAVVCTIAPSIDCLAETHNTLKFATRARRVKYRASINEFAGESALLKKYRARIRELEDQLEELQRRKSSVSFGPDGATHSSVNLSTIEERQMELQFAINNINRVILNSTARGSDPHRQSMVSSTGDHHHHQDPHPPHHDRHDHHGHPQHPRPSDNQHEHRVDSLSSSPSRSSFVKHPSQKKAQLEIAGIRTHQDHHKDHQDQTDDNQEEHDRPSFYQLPLDQIPHRPSLTTVLKTKYLDALWRMEEASRRSRSSQRDTFLSSCCAKPSERASMQQNHPNHHEHHEMEHQKQLLCEFVRGLELAEAEHEWRMEKIRDLEAENRQLKQILQSREEELMALKNISIEDETF